MTRRTLAVTGGRLVSGNRTASPPRRRPSALIGMVLLGATLATFGGVGGLAFVQDDYQYVVQNPHVARGLSLDGVRWAFTAAYASNWHPLTWLSHMVDVTLFDLAPAGHHLVNLAFHGANTLLLFLLLRSLTGALWRPALVAALFALHPLRVESVAWVAERKDVMSAFFGLFTLLAYTRQVRDPAPSRAASTAAFFALGLLAKPMVITLPFVMLLLDWWPLARPADREGGPHRARARWRELVSEKFPLFLLAAASAVATLWAQGKDGAIVSIDALPPSERLANAVVGYVRYFSLFLRPVDLALPYPLRVGIPAAELAASCLLLGAIGALAWRLRRPLPYLGFGYLWFVGMLVPVIGLVQVGHQALADRYTYLPLIGVGVVVAWGAADIAARSLLRRGALAVLSVAALLLLAALTRAQLAVWRDEETLFGHALRVTSDNEIAHNNLGVVLQERGRDEEAERHFRRALEINVWRPMPNLNLGRILAARGEIGAAEHHFRVALQGDPSSAQAHATLAGLLIDQGRIDEGLEHYRAALRLDPDAGETRERLAQALAAAGQTAAAADVYREVLRRDPGNAAAHLNRGVALSALGDSREAEAEIRESLRLAPGVGLAHRNLAILLDGLDKIPEAIEHYREAARLDPEDEVSRKRMTELLALQRGAFPSGR